MNQEGKLVRNNAKKKVNNLKDKPNYGWQVKGKIVLLKNSLTSIEIKKFTS